MNLNYIEQQLTQSFGDFKLSKQEKMSLKQIFENLKHKPDYLSFARNKAFDIVADNYRATESQYLESLKWLEEVIKTIDSVQNQVVETTTKAYFSPGNICVNKIIALIENAKQSIDVCVFTISDNNISQALLTAFKNGRKVRIISDNEKADDLGSDVYRLAENNVPVRLDQSTSHMHHKFALFDDEQLVNGSFNWTRSATKYNQENIVVSNDVKLVAQFKKTFETLWKTCISPD